MKGKILPFIIGLLVGAIIATGGFLIYQKNNKTKWIFKLEFDRIPTQGQLKGNLRSLANFIR